MVGEFGLRIRALMINRAKYRIEERQICIICTYLISITETLKKCTIISIFSRSNTKMTMCMSHDNNTILLFIFAAITKKNTTLLLIIYNRARVKATVCKKHDFLIVKTAEFM